MVPCRWRTGTLKNPKKSLWRWEPDCRYNFFFSPPAHLCRCIYNWTIVACDVKHQYHCIYGPSCPVRTGWVVVYSPSCPRAELSDYHKHWCLWNIWDCGPVSICRCMYNSSSRILKQRWPYLAYWLQVWWVLCYFDFSMQLVSVYS